MAVSTSHVTCSFQGWHTVSKGSKTEGEEKKGGQKTLTSKAAAKNAKRRAKKKKVSQTDSDVSQSSIAFLSNTTSNSLNGLFLFSTP